MNYKDYFIAIYSHECKAYCDEKFYGALFDSKIGDATIEIVDNSIDADYSEKLKELTKLDVKHIKVSRDEPSTQFLRNVAESLSYLRKLFLDTECKYFVTLETDVIVPEDWLHSFDEVKDKADIIGGIYYAGFHSEELFTNRNLFVETDHVLSGCTMYKREVIEKIPFRWSIENLGAFPDAWICYDAVRNGNKFRLANCSKVICDHLTKENSNSRGHEDIK